MAGAREETRGRACRSADELFGDLRKVGRRLSSREDASENEAGKLRNPGSRLQAAFRLVPLVDPVDHAEQGKGSGARADFSFRLIRSFVLRARVLNLVRFFGPQPSDFSRKWMYSFLRALMRLRKAGGRGWFSCSITVISRSRGLNTSFNVQADQGAH